MARTAKPRSKLEAARARMYRELVFECAEAVFAAKGFDEATMQDIAAEAGISLKTVYSVFPGKNEIYAAIQQQRAHDLFVTVIERLKADDDPLAALGHGVRAYVEFLLEHENFLRIHLRERIAWGLGPRDEIGADEYREGVAGYSAVIQRGIDDGLFYDGDPAMMAMMGVAIMQVQLARLGNGESRPTPEDLSEEIVLQLQRLFCRPEALADGGLRVATSASG